MGRLVIRLLAPEILGFVRQSVEQLPLNGARARLPECSITPITNELTVVNAKHWVLTFDYCVIWMRKGIGICRSAARALTKQYDAVWVSAEVGNVIVYPFNGGVNIEETKVLRGRRIGKLRCIWLTEDIESVVERHDCDVIVVSNYEPTVVCREIALRIQKGR